MLASSTAMRSHAFAVTLALLLAHSVEPARSSGADESRGQSEAPPEAEPVTPSGLKTGEQPACDESDGRKCEEPGKPACWRRRRVPEAVQAGVDAGRCGVGGRIRQKKLRTGARRLVHEEDPLRKSRRGTAGTVPRTRQPKHFFLHVAQHPGGPFHMKRRRTRRAYVQEFFL